MSIFTLFLTAEQPLLLTSLQGDPNSSISYPYIPGSVLRGALIGRYMQQGGIVNYRLDLHDAALQALFFDHSTRYLHAYLYADTQNVPHRLLPIPRSWRKEKSAEFSRKELPVTDTAFATFPTLDEPRSIGGDACWLHANGEIGGATVQRHINIHNQRDRVRGRGVEESGAVFRYEAIAPGQTFQAAIICDAEPAVEQILKDLLFPGSLWLGGSRSAGYGRVALHDVVPLPTWNEVGSIPAQRIKSGKQELRLTLLSELIIRDPRSGQHYAMLPLTSLAQYLGIGDLVVVPERSFRAQTYLGGFNRTWGLPLPQTVALAAGSVFTCTFTGSLDPQRVAALEHEGLGERCAEGFGRMAVNWQPLSNTFKLRKIEPSPYPTDVPKELSTSSQRLVENMAKRILRQRMERRLIELVGRITVHGEVSGTQLSRLRIVARRGLAKTEFTPVENLLKSLPQNARTQFEQARVEDNEESLSLLNWIERQMRMPHDNWTEADVTPVALTAKMSPLTPTDVLAREYTLRLIMALARKAVKEER